jgi:cephalosporin hydroxylase
LIAVPISRENPAKNVGSFAFEVDNWAISDFVARRLAPVVGCHPFPLHELMLMVAAVCRFERRLIFVWGTHIGKSARIFYECASHYRMEADIHSTDLPDDVTHLEHPHAARGKLVRGLPRIHLHQGDGLATWLDLWRSSGHKQRPLFFLDGDHAYESVLRELNGVMAEGHEAAILVHDTFYQSPEAGYNVGPHQAIATALAGRPDQYRIQESGLVLPGLTLLYPSTFLRTDSIARG